MIESTIATIIAPYPDHALVGACECTQQAVRRWRKGAVPNLRYAAGIAKVTGVSVREVRAMIEREYDAQRTKNAAG